jgi:hypothetical protein
MRPTQGQQRDVEKQKHYPFIGQPCDFVCKEHSLGKAHPIPLWRGVDPERMNADTEAIPGVCSYNKLQLDKQKPCGILAPLMAKEKRELVHFLGGHLAARSLA